TQKLESVYTAETDAHYLFDIDLNKDSSSIYLYHVKFSEQMPVTVDIRIDAPVTVDKSGKLFTYAGTNIIPYRLMGSTAVPAPGFIVTNLMCNVDTKRKYYEMYFECHGGSFAANGDLK
ncbi:MAG: hypothetical protein IKX18_07850, partial [Muribaculaceae bacterium]|nr:hypothetical protein [Muribaculaceae bacterium]